MEGTHGGSAFNANDAFRSLQVTHPLLETTSAVSEKDVQEFLLECSRVTTGGANGVPEGSKTMDPASRGGIPEPENPKTLKRRRHEEQQREAQERKKMKKEEAARRQKEEQELAAARRAEKKKQKLERKASQPLIKAEAEGTAGAENGTVGRMEEGAKEVVQEEEKAKKVAYLERLVAQSHPETVVVSVDLDALMAAVQRAAGAAYGEVHLARLDRSSFRLRLPSEEDAKSAVEGGIFNVAPSEFMVWRAGLKPVTKRGKRLAKKRDGPPPPHGLEQGPSLAALFATDSAVGTNHGGGGGARPEEDTWQGEKGVKGETEGGEEGQVAMEGVEAEAGEGPGEREAPSGGGLPEAAQSVGGAQGGEASSGGGAPEAVQVGVGPQRVEVPSGGGATPVLSGEVPQGGGEAPSGGGAPASAQDLKTLKRMRREEEQKEAQERKRRRKEEAARRQKEEQELAAARRAEKARQKEERKALRRPLSDGAEGSAGAQRGSEGNGGEGAKQTAPVDERAKKVAYLERLVAQSHPETVVVSVDLDALMAAVQRAAGAAYGEVHLARLDRSSFRLRLPSEEDAKRAVETGLLNVAPKEFLVWGVGTKTPTNRERLEVKEERERPPPPHGLEQGPSLAALFAADSAGGTNHGGGGADRPEEDTWQGEKGVKGETEGGDEGQEMMEGVEAEAGEGPGEREAPSGGGLPEAAWSWESIGGIGRGWEGRRG